MLTALLVIVVTALLAYVYRSRRKQLAKLGEHGIPVRSPNILLGNMMDTHFAKEPAHITQTNWIKEYGKIYGKYEGLKMRVVVADLDVINRMLIKDFHVFTNRPTFGLTKMLINQENQRWKNLRRVMSPTFSSSKMKKMFELMSDCVDLTVDVVQKKSESGKGFDVYSAFQALTLDVIGRSALAMNIDCQTDPKNRVLELVRQFFQGKIPVFILLTLLFPSVETVFWRAHKAFSTGSQVERVICENISRVMKERRQNPEAYKKVVDVLQLLLEAQKNGGDFSTDSQDGDPFKTSAAEHGEGSSAERTRVELDDEDVTENAWMFLLAGYETTSNALAYTMYHLVKHPEVQERIRDEIRSVTGVEELSELDGRAAIDYAAVGKMEYLQQVLDESMRISPPVPLFVTRRCAEDYPIPGYGGKSVPKGASIEIPVWHIHHDPEIYPNPEIFDPERFSSEEKAKRHPMAYLPFGAGPRICIGMRFALLEAKLCLARLLSRFSFVADGKNFNDPMPTELRFAILNPLGGVWVKALAVNPEPAKN